MNLATNDLNQDLFTVCIVLITSHHKIYHQFFPFQYKNISPELWNSVLDSGHLLEPVFTDNM